MDVGLARVSTLDQNPQLQLSALRAAGCWPIYEEKVSGKADTVHEIRDQVLRELSAGDRLTTWKLDRLGRSLHELEDIVFGLERRGIKFRSLTESIDTSTPQGRFFFQMLGAFAEWERNIIIERTRAGKAAAREAGKFPGGHRLFGFPDKDVPEAQAKLEADLLRQAADHVLHGGSLRQLVNTWNRSNVSTKSGKGTWRETVVRRMLVNPRMVPILGEQTHQDLVRLFAPARERQRLGAPAIHLLSGILRCAVCEQPMYAAVERKRPVYRCRREGGGRYGGCGAVSIAGPTVERWVTDALIAAVCAPEFTERLNVRRAELLSGDVTAEQLDEWRQEVDDLETVLKTRFGADVHRIRLHELQRLVRQATTRLLQRPDLQELLDLPKTEEELRKAWGGWDVAQRRRKLKLLLNHIRVLPAGRTGRRFNGRRLDPDWKV